MTATITLTPRLALAANLLEGHQYIVCLGYHDFMDITVMYPYQMAREWRN